MTSIEGNRGEPRPRPPFPAQKGLWGKPTLLNNVETYATIPVIILKGAGWYAHVRHREEQGHQGLRPGRRGEQHRPRGDPHRHAAGRDHLRHRRRHARRQDLQGRADRRTLGRLHPEGAPERAGGLREPERARRHHGLGRPHRAWTTTPAWSTWPGSSSSSCRRSRCGKCTPCRIGTKRMLEILERICEGKGDEGDIERLEELGGIIKDTALCGLGQTAPNPVLSTIRHFREEFVEHIRDHKCRAGVCAELVRAPCQNACPAGVDVPGFVSLIGERRFDEALRLHRERNPFVAVCARVCFHPCEGKCRRSTLDESRLDPQPQALHGRPGEDVPAAGGARRTRKNAARKIADRGRGPRGPLVRLLPGPARLQADRVRGRERSPAACSCRPFPPTGCRARSWRARSAMIEKLGVEIKTGQAAGPGLHPDGPAREGRRGRVPRRRRAEGHRPRPEGRGREGRGRGHRVPARRTTCAGKAPKAASRWW